MKLIGIDTSTRATGVALFSFTEELGQDRDWRTQSGQFEGISIIEQERTRAEQMLPIMGKMLEELQISLKQIDAIAVAVGPGSFTGLRIGVTIAKTIAQFSHKAVVGVSTLEALAAGWNKNRFLIVPVLDARANRIFSAAYIQNSGDLCLESVLDENLYYEEDYRERLNQVMAEHPQLEGIFFVGEGAEKHPSLWKNSPFFVERATGERQSSAVKQLCILAGKRFIRKEFDSAFDLTPHYLRKSQAEMDREKE